MLSVAKSGQYYEITGAENAQWSYIEYIPSNIHGFDALCFGYSIGLWWIYVINLLMFFRDVALGQLKDFPCTSYITLEDTGKIYQ